jgi:hypothetical protein
LVSVWSIQKLTELILDVNAMVGLPDHADISL